jgi:hypothetical protein
MWHTCGCNVGCAGVRVAPGDLREGKRVTVVSGVQKGKDATVVRRDAQDGTRVLALDYEGDDVPRGCENERRSANLLGFACQASKSGPVPVNACASGCE